MAALAPAPLKASEIRICIAIDISSSTKGSPLQSESSATEKICELLNQHTPDPLTVLPWSGETHTTISLPGSITVLNYLGSDYGTNPTCLYTYTKYLEALRECGMWFLFTDGQFNSDDVQNFARTTTRLGLHGTANVVVIFGHISRSLPAAPLQPRMATNAGLPSSDDSLFSLDQALSSWAKCALCHGESVLALLVQSAVDDEKSVPQNDGVQSSTSTATALDPYPGPTRETHLFSPLLRCLCQLPHSHAS
jgi:hypothetical protein